MAIQPSASSDGDVIYPDGKKNGLVELLQFLLSPIFSINFMLFVGILIFFFKDIHNVPSSAANYLIISRRELLYS